MRREGEGEEGLSERKLEVTEGNFLLRLRLHHLHHQPEHSDTWRWQPKPLQHDLTSSLTSANGAFVRRNTFDKSSQREVGEPLWTANVTVVKARQKHQRIMTGKIFHKFAETVMEAALLPEPEAAERRTSARNVDLIWGKDDVVLSRLLLLFLFSFSAHLSSGVGGREDGSSQSLSLPVRCPQAAGQCVVSLPWISPTGPAGRLLA